MGLGVGSAEGIGLGDGLGINDGLPLGAVVVGSLLGLGEGIIDGAGVGSRVVGTRVGLGVGKTEGLSVGKGVGKAVGSHMVYVSHQDVDCPPVVISMSYIVHGLVARGGVFVRFGLSVS